MKQYDMKCPICGAVNRGLYLEETDGWMECENCHADVHICDNHIIAVSPAFMLKTLKGTCVANSASQV